MEREFNANDTAIWLFMGWLKIVLAATKQPQW